jgi:hypothetical protein
MPPDAHRLRPDHHPTPFSADEIRRGCPPGRTIRTRVERAGVEPVIRVTRFVGGDAEGADHEVWTETPTGERVGNVERRRSTWLDFQSHASMPIANTVIGEETIDIPAGAFDCLVYTRTDGDEISTFWFAKSAPGMPLKYESRVSDALVFSSVALENLLPADADAGAEVG